MYSSPKFFVPSVIAGFGPDPVVVGALVLLPPPPPQAVRPIRSATPKEIANAALAARRVCFRNILALLSWCPRPGDPTPSEASDARPLAGQGTVRAPSRARLRPHRTRLRARLTLRRSRI